MTGAWRGRQAEELMAQQVNVEVIDELKRVWDQGVNKNRQNEFVNIGTLDPKVDDPILVEAAGLLPRQTVKYAESVFGKGVLMVRREMLKDTFGARQASVGDLFTGNTRWNPKVAKHFEKIAVGLFGYAGKDAFTTLVGSEQNIQDVVSGIKQTIVVRSVIVPVANMTFNMFQLLNRGVPLTTVIRGMGAKTAEINSYVKKRKREIDLEADLRAARGKNDDGAVLRIESQVQSIKVDRPVPDRNGRKVIVLDMESSVSPIHGDQEGSAWNWHFYCTCHHPILFAPLSEGAMGAWVQGVDLASKQFSSKVAC